jgi:hypothetical protein
VRILLACALFSTGCLVLPASENADAAHATDGPLPDATYAVDGPLPSDAGPFQYSNLDDTTKWTVFDPTTVDSRNRGFRGAAFDGRYIYFVPSDNAPPLSGVVARYDTQASFIDASSWSTFNATTVNPGSQGFVGGAFDGRYVYLVPFSNVYGVTDGVVTRYDTQASFGDPSSWSTFDTATVDASATGFGGAAFDGRYIYLVPAYNGTLDGIVARYDTQSTFTTATSWITFDVASVNANAVSYDGAVFDGRYLYLVPNDSKSLVARYDTQASFGTASSWTIFDTTNVDPVAKGFHGGAFDGRYVYFIPWYNGTAIHGLVARYDTRASFGATTSWETFSTTSVNANAKGFMGAAFDGRYVYLVPYNNNGALNDGILARYDTEATFADAASWTTFDIASVNANAIGFDGAAFDGRYLYLAPNNGGASGLAARFDAKQPAALPQLCSSAAALHCFSGSFY